MAPLMEHHFEAIFSPPPTPPPQPYLYVLPSDILIHLPHFPTQYSSPSVSPPPLFNGEVWTVSVSYLRRLGRTGERGRRLQCPVDDFRVRRAPVCFKLNGLAGTYPFCPGTYIYTFSYQVLSVCDVFGI